MNAPDLSDNIKELLFKIKISFYENLYIYSQRHLNSSNAEARSSSEHCVKTYDLFDTLITRVFPHPIDSFYFFGKSLKTQNFIQERLSEERTRKSKTGSEVTLEDIYYKFNEILNLSSSNLELVKELEKKWEIDSLRKIKENLVEETNEPFFIVSDTYFDKRFINDVLDKFSISPSKLYLSSDNNKTKFSGELFKYIMKDNKLNPNRLNHLGDNYISDLKAPTSLGINAHLYLNSRMNKYEQMIYNPPNKNELKCVLSGVMRVTRLSGKTGNENFKVIWDTTSDVISPFIFSYVLWILEQARKNSIDTLFFVSRDGQILYKVAEIIKDVFHYDVNTKYIHGSRKAWFLPSILNMKSEEIDWIFDSVYCSIASICKRIAVDYSEISDSFNTIDHEDIKRNLTQRERRILKNSILNDQKIRNIILKNAKTKRIILTEYLKQVGFSNSNKIGLVDVGWRGRLQRSLSRILDAEGIYPNTGIHGFYVGLNENQVSPYQNDCYHTFYNKNQMKCLRNGQIFEIFTFADHGMCLGYKITKDGIDSILSDEPMSQPFAWGVGIQHECITKFSEELARSLLKYQITEFTSLYKSVFKLTNSFINSPTAEQAQSYGKILFSDDQEEDGQIQLANMITAFDVIFLPLTRNFRKYGLWVEGTIKLSFGKFSFLLLIFPYIRHKIIRLMQKLDRVRELMGRWCV